MADRDRWYQADRLGGLRRFAFALTAFNILGHTVFGFEQAIIHPLAALATGYTMELLLESLTAWSQGRRPKFLGGARAFFNFLLPAHISGLAIAMLLYTNDRVAPVMFAVAVAMGSKYLLRVAANGGSRHFLNPSNLGISVTLLLFPWVGIAPPYQFTENLSGWGDWVLPGIIVASGSFLNARFTHRWPLITAWLLGFIGQAGLRSALFGNAFLPSLLPMTGVAFLLFTYYMVTDPPTTPSRPRDQVIFGASVAVVYGILVALHVVFGLFFALTTVCVVRGLILVVRSGAEARAPVAVPAPAFMGRPRT